MARGFACCCGGAVVPNAHAEACTLTEGMQKWFATISRQDGDFGQAWRTCYSSELSLGDGWGLTAKFEGGFPIGDKHDDRSDFRVGLPKAVATGERGSVSNTASVLAGESLDGPECIGEGLEG